MFCCACNFFTINIFYYFGSLNLKLYIVLWFCVLFLYNRFVYVVFIFYIFSIRCFLGASFILKLLSCVFLIRLYYGWVKKLKNRLNRENIKKKNWKNWTVKKTRLNRLKFWKNRPVWFYKQKTKKTELNRTQTEKTRKKPSQIGLNLFLP